MANISDISIRRSSAVKAGATFINNEQEAMRRRKGTNLLKFSSGTMTSAIAPTAAPSEHAINILACSLIIGFTSWRLLAKAKIFAGDTPIALVIAALMGLRPTATNIGKEKTEAPPAAPLKIPTSRPTSTIRKNFITGAIMIDI